ncbi:hypothetical protein Lal_00046739 [Lupinus albus]|nr:hypothetical protein Lal_00046739 [Lupinus albus]
MDELKYEGENLGLYNMVSEHELILRPRITKMARRGRGRESGQNDLLALIAVKALSSPNSHPLAPQGPVEYRGLDEFCRRGPNQFHGRFAPDVANEWVQDMEKIFRAMGCAEAKRVTYACKNKIATKRGVN